MGFFKDLLNGNSDYTGEAPNYLKNKFGINDNTPSYNPNTPHKPKWVCPRCGTTNVGGRNLCKECKNLNPYN